MEKLLAFAIFSGLWFTFPALNAVKITTGDNQEFEYTREVDIDALRQNITIDSFLSDFEYLEEVTVPLPEVSAASWQNIMFCSQLLHAVRPLEGDDKQAKLKELNDTLAVLDRDNLYAFIKGVGYVHNAGLLNIALDQ